MTELALITAEPSQEIAALKPFAQQLAEIKKANATFVFDYADPKQNEAARSHIAKLRKTKAAIEKAAKAEREDSLRHQRAVIAREKELVAEVVEMIEHHDKPLQEYEEIERQRKDAIQQRVRDMEITAEFLMGKTSAQLHARYAEIHAVNTNEEFEEFQAGAIFAREQALDRLSASITAAEKLEAEQAELERLRAEKDARDKADAEAAEKARAEKEETERKERETREAAEAAEKERQRQADEDARIALEREEAATAERERVQREADGRETRLREDKERVEKEATESEERRIREAAEAEERRLRETREAEERQTAAVQAERERSEREAREKQAEEDRRAADRDHRGKIHSAIVADLIPVLKSQQDAGNFGHAEELAKKIVIAICGDQIRHLKILY